MRLEIDYGSWGLSSRSNVTVVLPDGRLVVQQTLFQSQPNLAFLQIDRQYPGRYGHALTELLLGELKGGICKVHGWDQSSNSIGQRHD